MPPRYSHISLSKEKPIMSLSKALLLLVPFPFQASAASIYPVTPTLFLGVIFHAFIVFTTHRLTHPHQFWFLYLSWMICVFTPTAWTNFSSFVLWPLLDAFWQESLSLVLPVSRAFSTHMQDDTSQTSTWNSNQHFNVNWFKTSSFTSLLHFNK